MSRKPTVLTVVATALLLGAMGVGSADESEDIAAGRMIAETYCATCHAIGPDGDSPREGAPRFRELSRNYPIDNLEEALAEGIVTSHPDMPQFEMAPEEIGAFLAYLKSIQAGALSEEADTGSSTESAPSQ